MIAGACVYSTNAAIHALARLRNTLFVRVQSVRSVGK